MKKIHELDSAKAFGVSKVPTPDKLPTIPVPTKALKLVAKRYKEYTESMKENKHASLWNKIQHKAGHRFTQQADPKEMQRLDNLKRIFRRTKPFLDGAKDFFAGCKEVGIIKKYSDKVDKDFAEAVSKKYIRQQDIQDDPTEFPKKKFRIRKPAGTINVVQTSQLNTEAVYENDNYKDQVSAYYRFAYETFKALLKTKRRLVSIDQEIYLLEYLARPRGQLSSGMSLRLRDSVKHLEAATKRFTKEKKYISELKDDKKFIKLLNQEFKRQFQTLLLKCEHAEKQLRICVDGAWGRYFMATNPSPQRGQPDAAADAMVGISAAVQSIANNMQLYYDNAIGGEPLEDTFSSIYTGLVALHDTIRAVSNSPFARQILDKQTHAKDYMKTFDKYTANLETVYSATSACAKGMTEFIKEMRERQEQKDAVKRAWIFLAIGSLLGLVQSLLNPLSRLLTTVQEDPGIAPLTR